MQKILVLGAGRSSSTLISFLLEHAEKHDWHVMIGDIDLKTAQSKINDHTKAEAVAFDINNSASHQLISESNPMSAIEILLKSVEEPDESI